MPKNFDDISIKPNPGEHWVECPVCFGHGRWNLKLNVYGKHFQAFCDQCNAFGYVLKNGPNVSCIHEMQVIQHVSPTYHKEKCNKCEYIKYIDSSG